MDFQYPVLIQQFNNLSTPSPIIFNTLSYCFIFVVLKGINMLYVNSPVFIWSMNNDWFGCDIFTCKKYTSAAFGNLELDEVKR